MTVDTPARLLRLLAMFTTRATWSADELAGRLEVTTRTLRRDVTRLRDLGYPIASTTGRYGGYELGAGGRLPPLLLDDDEAIAVSVAFRELSVDADPTLGEAALSASTKLRQVLPEALRDRVDALGEVVVGVRQGRAAGHREADGPHRAAEPDGPGDVLPARRRVRSRIATAPTASASAASNRTGSCRSVGGGTSSDSTSTVTTGGPTASIGSATSCATGHRNTPRETPDAGALVAEGVAVRVFETRTRVLVHAPSQEVAMYIGPTIGVVEQSPPGRRPLRRDDRGRPRLGGSLSAGLPVDFEVLEPPEVRDELRALAERLLRHNAERCFRIGEPVDAQGG